MLPDMQNLTAMKIMNFYQRLYL